SGYGWRRILPRRDHRREPLDATRCDVGSAVHPLLLAENDRAAAPGSRTRAGPPCAKHATRVRPLGGRPEILAPTRDMSLGSRSRVRLRGDDLPVNVVRQPLDVLAELLCELREPRVLFEELEELRRLLRRE